MSDRLLTTRQVADRLGLSPETVLRRWRRGDLPGYRISGNALRFDPDELEAWLQARRSPNRDTSTTLRERGPSGAQTSPARGHRRYQLPCAPTL